MPESPADAPRHVRPNLDNGDRWRGGTRSTAVRLRARKWDPSKPLPDAKMERYAQLSARGLSGRECERRLGIAHKTGMRWAGGKDELSLAILARRDHIQATAPVVLPSAARLFHDIYVTAKNAAETGQSKAAIDGLKFLYQVRSEAEEKGYVDAEGVTLDSDEADAILDSAVRADAENPEPDEEPEPTPYVDEDGEPLELGQEGDDDE